MSMHSIVVGVDGREKSYRALSFGVGLAQREGASLAVCYVRPFVTWQTLALTALSAMSATWSPPASSAEDADGCASELARETALLSEQTGVPAQFIIMQGNPVTEIASLAHYHDSDLIVLGHTRRFRMGSLLAHRVSNGFRQSVLMTP